MLGSFVDAGVSQAVAGEADAVRVVDDAIEDGIGIGGVTDQFMPFVDRDMVECRP